MVQNLNCFDFFRLSVTVVHPRCARRQSTGCHVCCLIVRIGLCYHVMSTELQKFVKGFQIH